MEDGSQISDGGEQRAEGGRCSAILTSPGFTLLELLVVVAIIGILVGIMLPAVGGIKLKAQIKKAESDVKSLAVACRAYRSEYGHWVENTPQPHLSTDTFFMEKLTAANPSANPKQINFIEWQRPKAGDPGMVDPFRSNQAYRISISVENNSVTVWSFGPNGTNGGGDDISVKN